MKILPDGTVEIRNKQTGETKIVQPQDLPSYGINYDDYVTQAEAFGKMNPPPSTATTSATQTTSSTPLLKEEQSDKEKEAAKVKGELVKNAQSVISVIKQIKEGKLKGDAAKTALNFASSRFAKSYGFGEGGKALTEPELTILGGSMPVIRQKGQNIIQKLTGEIPPQTGEVTDDLDTLERKMKLVLLADQGKFDEANKILNEIGGNNSSFIEGLSKNAGSDTKNLLNSILNIPNVVQGGIASNIQQGKPIDLMHLLVQGGLNVGKSTLSEYNQLLGEPQKGGDIAGRVLQRAYDRPVTTLLDILPFLKGVKGGVGNTLNKVEDVGNVSKIEGPLQKVLNLPKETGSKIRQGVRNIDAGPSIYGPQREAQIIKTLDNLGIKGSPAQQYSQLQPMVSKIENQVQSYLEKNSKPIPYGKVQEGFIANLQEELRSANLTSNIAKKEIKGYLDDVGIKESKGGIETKELFKIKQKINKDYRNIQKKIDKGTPLNDREKVIFVGRKTIDDIISKEHPEVKQATLAQSNLYDAVESLHKSRKNVPSINILGNRINIPDFRGGQDMLGRILQGGGGSSF